MRSQLVRACILETLSELNSPTAERTLFVALNSVFRLRVTYSELREQLQHLDREARIIGVKRGNAETVLWSISAEGRAELAEQN